MKFKTTIMLIVILAVIVGLSLYFDVFTPESKKAHKVGVIEAKEWLLISPKFKDLRKIKLEIKGRGYLVFEKKNDKWSIVEPIKAKAVSWEVLDLISAFEDAKKLETITPGKGEYKDIALKDLGLDEPIVTVTFYDKDRTITVLVGKNVIASDNTYVKFKNDNRVFIIDQNLRKKIKRDPLAYRDKRVWDIEREKLKELTYIHQGKRYKFRKEDDKWYIFEPIRGKADKDKLSDAVDAIIWLDADEFIDDNPKSLTPYGLDKPIWKVTAIEEEEIKKKEKEKKKDAKKAKSPTTQKTTTKPTIKRSKHILLIGQVSGLSADKYYAKLADRKWIFTIKKSDFEKIVPNITTCWRSEKVIDIEKDKISRVDIIQDGRKFTLKKINNSWKLIVNKKQIATDTDAVDALLDELTKLKAESFIDERDKVKFGKHIGTVKIYPSDVPTPVTIRIGGKTASGLYRLIERAGIDYYFVVKADSFDKILRPTLAYYEKTLIKFDMDDVKKVTIAHQDRVCEITRLDKDSPWVVQKPIKRKADEEKVNDLLTDLMTLKADEFTDKIKAQKFKWDTKIEIATEKKVKVIKPQTTQPTTTQPSSTTQPTTQKSKPEYKIIKQKYVVLLAKRNGEVWVCVPDSGKPIAKVSSKILEDATVEFIDTGVFKALSTDDVREIQIIRADGKLKLVKKETKWVYPADIVVKFDDDKVKDFLNDFKEFKGKKIVDFKGNIKRYKLNKPTVEVIIKTGKGAYSLKISRLGTLYYAYTNQVNWILLIDKSTFEKFNKTIKDFVK